MAPPKKTTDGRKLIPEVIQAVLGNKTLKHATKPLSHDDKELLSRGLKMDVDEWRKEFGEKLREAGLELLADLRARKDELKAGEIAYSLAVVADKASALENRSQTLTTQVNQQVNNFYGHSKEELLGLLDGNKPTITVSAQPSAQNAPTASETIPPPTPKAEGSQDMSAS